MPVFDSPLVTAQGRERIMHQFALAFAISGLCVRSELRDVICSDFEFDGTRAGIIDQVITVSFLPNLLGIEETPSVAPSSAHSNITPHPFANYSMPSANSVLRRHSQSSAGISPSARTALGLTEKSRANLHTMGPDAGILSPLEMEGPMLPVSSGVASTHKHWTAPPGLGRQPLWLLLYDLVNPVHALRSLMSVKMRLLSRLEFNEAGRIVRHEDVWSAREMVYSIFPLLGLRASLSCRH